MAYGGGGGGGVGGVGGGGCFSIRFLHMLNIYLIQYLTLKCCGSFISLCRSYRTARLNQLVLMVG